MKKQKWRQLDADGVITALGAQCPACANMLPETLMNYKVRDEDKK